MTYATIATFIITCFLCQMYISLAQETGGLIYFGDEDDIGDVFVTLEQRTRDDFVTIHRSSLVLNGPATVPVPVDDTLESISFSTTSYYGSIASVRVTQPDGTVITSSSSNATITNLGDNQIVLVMQPMVGIWKIEVDGTGPVSMVVQGNSAIGINFLELVKLVPGREGDQFAEVGSPVLDGNPSTALTRVDGPISDFSFGTIDEDGSLISTVTDISTEFEATSGKLVLRFSTPSSPFGIKVSGTTVAGNAFQRLATRTFVPQTIKVSFNEWSRPLAIPDGHDTTVHFIVENFRNQAVTIDINVTDDHNYVTSFAPVQLMLEKNSSVTINATDIVFVTASAVVSGELLGASDTAMFGDVCEDAPKPRDVSTFCYCVNDTSNASC
jgi:hypothetical protein